MALSAVAHEAANPSETSIATLLGLLVRDPNLIIRFDPRDYARGGPKVRLEGLVETGGFYQLLVKRVSANAERLNLSVTGDHSVVLRGARPGQRARHEEVIRTINLVRDGAIVLPRLQVYVGEETRRVLLRFDFVVEAEDDFLALDLTGLELVPTDFKGAAGELMLVTLLQDLPRLQATLKAVETAIQNTPDGPRRALQRRGVYVSEPRVERREKKGERYVAQCVTYELEVPVTSVVEVVKSARTADALQALYDRARVLRRLIAEKRFLMRCCVMALEQSTTIAWGRAKRRKGTTCERHRAILQGVSVVRKRWEKRVER